MFWTRCLSCDVHSTALSKLSESAKPDEALDASAHATQLQNMTSTMGKYQHQKNTILTLVKNHNITMT